MTTDISYPEQRPSRIPSIVRTAGRRLLVAALLATQSAGLALGQPAPRASGDTIALGASTLVPAGTAAQDESFHAISALALTPAATLVVADNRDHRMYVFDTHGRHLVTVPMRSSGGSPVFATALGTDTAATIFVYDQTTQLVHVYSLASGGAVEIRRFKVDVQGAHMCVDGGNVYILGYHDGHIIHQYSSRGHWIRSFGRPFGSTEAVRAEATGAASRLTCARESGLVFAAFSIAAAPGVTAFGTDGSERWAFAIPDFQSVSVRALPGDRVSFTKTTPALDDIESVFSIGSDVVAVQVLRGGRPDSLTHRPWTLETFLLRQRDGALIGRQISLPVIAAANPSLLASRDEGSARVRVFSFQLHEPSK